MTSDESKKVVAGIDVASDELVVRVSVDDEIRRYSNAATGIRELVKVLQQLGVTLVVCEHTGRHEWALLEALWEHDIAVHCAHPKAVHNFAKALKVNAKSDPLDATTLMEYGMRMEAPPTQRPAPELCLLRELTARRQDLNDMLVKERNRLQAPGVSPVIKRSIRTHIKQLLAAIKALQAQVKELVRKHPTLERPINRLDQEHGVGLVSAAAIYANMPELGSLTRQTSAALAGLAPFLRESGKFSGQRKISGGRTLARTALYMVALTVVRKKDHPLSRLYKRLKAAGKHTSVALTAVMRKLIIRFNTVLRELRAQEQKMAVSA
jgi:transposase